MPRPRLALAIGISALAPFSPLLAAATQETPSGVVVASLDPRSAPARAGLAVGDLLLRWDRPPVSAAIPAARGELATPLDWLWLLHEEAPRGPLRIAALRDGRPLEVELTTTIEALEIGPSPSPTDDAAWIRAWWLEHRAADAHATRRALSAAIEAHQRALSLLAEPPTDQPGDAWTPSTATAHRELAGVESNLGLAAVLLRHGSQDEAFAAFDRAIATAEATWGDSLILARTLHEAGQARASRGQSAAAEPLLQRALAVAEREAPESVPVATCLRSLAQLASRRGDLEPAEALADRALAIHEKHAPDTLLLATTLAIRGTVAAMRGQLDIATAHTERAATLQERWAPSGPELARSYNNLGIHAWQRGDLATAERYYRRSLDLKERHAPGDPSLASSLNNLGVVASQRGDLPAAEAYFGRALELWEARAPDSPEVGSSLANLGTVAAQRGDLERARSYLERALRHYQALAPDSDDVAGCHNSLGTVASQGKDYDTAEGHFRRALAIAQAIAPEGARMASTLHSLGTVASERGDLAAAEAHYRAALAIREKTAPDSLGTAESIAGLGDLALKRDDLETAEAHLRRALELFERWAPSTVDEAEIWHALGRIDRRRGRLAASAASYEKAIEAIESQLGRLGGSEDSRARFRARFRAYYRDLIEVLIELGQPETAFSVLERSRARSLLALLAERDLVFSLDLPSDLEARRRQTTAARDRIQSQLYAQAGRSQPEKEAALRGRLRELEREQAELREEIRRRFPRFASLQYPEPLDLAGTRARLDTGTLLLSYSVHPEASILFALTAAGDFRVVRIETGAARLRELVGRLRAAVADGRGGADDLAAVLGPAEDLYRLLLAPVAAEIEAAARLLIVPDGPLYLLPFPALARPDADASGLRYLIAWKPLHTAPSATVYAQLVADREVSQTASDSTLVAFGDPDYLALAGEPVDAGDTTPDLELRTLATRRGGFTPLPSTRTEVESIRALWGEKARAFLGTEATEEQAKRVAPEAGVLHFAAHGLLDESFPLSSGLALSLRPQPGPGQDNGLLQAWEIFEQVRLDADLVTLSSCDSALGREVDGEGLVGLTRAFQYAGARTVLASLWSIADATTAALMELFYRALRAGQPKDEALRSAQLALLQEPVTVGGARPLDASHPFYWAAFQLHGDWR